jgi:hypothetical protein
MASKLTTIQKLRALPTSEVERRCLSAQECNQSQKFWRYYFELALRKLEAQAKETG